MTLTVREADGLVTVKVSDWDGSRSEHLDPAQAREAADKLELLADQAETDQ